MEAELLLNRRTGNPQLDLLKVLTTHTERLELTFSVLASILCPANMDFSSKCIGKALKDKRRGEIESLEWRRLFSLQSCDSTARVRLLVPG